VFTFAGDVVPVRRSLVLYEGRWHHLQDYELGLSSPKNVSVLGNEINVTVIQPQLSIGDYVKGTYQL
jgi:hypothetical protein